MEAVSIARNAQSVNVGTWTVSTDGIHRQKILLIHVMNVMDTDPMPNEMKKCKTCNGTKEKVSYEPCPDCTEAKVPLACHICNKLPCDTYFVLGKCDYLTPSGKGHPADYCHSYHIEAKEEVCGECDGKGVVLDGRILPGRQGPTLQEYPCPICTPKPKEACRVCKIENWKQCERCGVCARCHLVGSGFCDFGIGTPVPKEDLCTVCYKPFTDNLRLGSPSTDPVMRGPMHAQCSSVPTPTKEQLEAAGVVPDEGWEKEFGERFFGAIPDYTFQLIEAHITRLLSQQKAWHEEVVAKMREKVADAVSGRRYDEDFDDCKRVMSAFDKAIQPNP